VRDQFLLVLTTRQLRCCDRVTGLDPKVTDVVPVDGVAGELEPGDPLPPGTTVQGDLTAPGAGSDGRDSPAVSVGTGIGSRPGLAALQGTRAASLTGRRRSGAPRMGLAAVNAMQRRLADETQRLSMRLRDPAAVPARDGELLLRSILSAVLEDPRRRGALAKGAGSLGLSKRQVGRLAEALGRPGQALTRLDLLTAPDRVFESGIGRKGIAALRLRLVAAGLPVAASSRRRRPRPRRHGR
jgi:hypothetical protein